MQARSRNSKWESTCQKQKKEKNVQPSSSSIDFIQYGEKKKKKRNIYPQKEENLSTTKISCISDDFSVIIKVICSSNSC